MERRWDIGRVNLVATRDVCCHFRRDLAIRLSGHVDWLASMAIRTFQCSPCATGGLPIAFHRLCIGNLSVSRNLSGPRPKRLVTSPNCRLGSISADPVVDLDGRKQSASLRGTEADLHERRDRPRGVARERPVCGITSPAVVASDRSSWHGACIYWIGVLPLHCRLSVRSQLRLLHHALPLFQLALDESAQLIRRA